MTKEDFKLWCFEHKSACFESNIRNKFQDIYQEILSLTEFSESFSFSQKLYHYLNDDADLKLGICPICGNRCRFRQFTTGYNTYCSLECSNIGKGESISKTILGKTQEEKELIEEKRKTTLKNKYGNNYKKIIGSKVSETRNAFTDEKWEEIHEKYHQTCLDKYGEDSFSKTDKFKEIFDDDTERQSKIKQTKLERYGDSNYINIDKTKQTCLERYGVDWVSKNKDICKKQQDNYLKTCLERYGVDNTSKLDSVKKKISKSHTDNFITKYNDIIISYNNNEYICKCSCKECNKCQEKIFTIEKTLFHNRVKYNPNSLCPIRNPKGQFSISQPQLDLKDFISSIYDGEIKMCDKSILNGKELDIYLPDKNIAFEFNGLYWHSELHKDKLYHQEKSKLCLEKGIQLIHIWEDDWMYKRDIIKDLIKTKLGLNENKLYARKLTIKEISQSECSEFLNMYHLQGSVNSSIRIGLFNNDELVEVLTFGKKRNFMKSKSVSNSEYELYRLCTKAGVSVIGGFSKLLKYFIRNYNPTEIVTYASLDISNANVYKLNGFKLDSISNPDYYWVVDGIRQHRFKFRKDILVKNGADKNKSEFEIMSEQGYYRIFGSGNYKLKYTF